MSTEYCFIGFQGQDLLLRAVKSRQAGTLSGQMQLTEWSRAVLRVEVGLGGLWRRL